MIIERIQIVGINSFADGIDIDLLPLPPGVVAIVGDNGTGKTTLIEAVPAALYQDLPSRDPSSIPDYVVADEALISVTFRHAGHGYVIKNKIRGRSQSPTLYQSNGVGPLAPLTSGIGDFKKRIEGMFGPKEAFYASVFAAQGGAGRFGALSRAERRSLFRYYLGLDVMHGIHESARSLASEVAKSGAGEAQQRFDAAKVEISRIKGDQAADIAALERAEKELAIVEEEHESLSAKADLVRTHEQLRSLQRDFADFADQLKSLKKTAAERVKPVPTKARIAKLDGKIAECVSDLEKIAGVRQRLSSLGLAIRAKTEAKSSVEEEAEIIDTVPCGGRGKYASCRFLERAANASERVVQLNREIAELNEVRSEAKNSYEGLDPTIVNQRHAAFTSQRDQFLSLRDRRVRALERVDHAKSQVPIIKKRLEDKQDEISKVYVLLPKRDDGSVDDDAIPSQETVLMAARKVKAISATVATLKERIAGRQRDLERFIEDANHYRSLANRKAGLIASLKSYELIATAFGPDGIQAMEIDSAGPDVSDVCNDLLDACFGGRFAVNLVTRVPKADGSGFKEAFDLEIVDNGRSSGSRRLGQLSYGEQAIIGECFRVALAIIATRRLGVQIETLWRDEVIGELSSVNTGRYCAMLARAREVGQFHHVFFVTHSESVADLVDSVIAIRDEGNVSVRVR